MNKLNWIELSPIGNAIGWTIIDSIWQLILLALVLNTMLRFIPRSRANMRYILASVSLGFALLWASYTFYYHWNTSIYASEIINTQSKKVAADVLYSITNDNYTSHSISQWQQLKAHLAPVMPYITTTWLIGLCLSLLYILMGFYHLKQLYRSSADSSSTDLQQNFQALVQRMGIQKDVQLLLSNTISEPITFQLGKSVVLLPLALLSNMPPAQIEVLLLHELAHIKRHDFIINLIQSIIETLFFYHPAIWWISKIIREEREHCCDDLVMQMQDSPFVYADALTQLQAYHLSTKTYIAMSAKGKNGILSKRIFRLFGQYDQQPSVFKSLFMVFILCISFTTQALFVVAQEPAPKEIPELKPSKQDGDKKPLLILDGKVLGNMANQKIDQLVQPEAIERINVLKGEAAILKYGDKAQNGVIEIWTKKAADAGLMPEEKEIENKELDEQKQGKVKVMPGKEKIKEKEKEKGKANLFRGRVLDAKNKPLIGATVLIKDTKLGTITDLGGYFELKLPNDCATVVISYVNKPDHTIENACNGNFTAINLGTPAPNQGKAEGKKISNEKIN